MMIKSWILVTLYLINSTFCYAADNIVEIPPTDTVQLNYDSTNGKLVDKFMQKSVIKGNQNLVLEQSKYNPCGNMIKRTEFYDKDGNLSKVESTPSPEAFYCINKLADNDSMSKLIKVIETDTKRRGIVQGVLGAIVAPYIYAAGK